MQSTKRTWAPRHQHNSSPTRSPRDGHGPHSIRILLVDDQIIFRETFRTWLTSNPDTEVVGEAGNAQDAVQLVGTLHPTLVVTETCFQRNHGIEGIRQIKSMYPEVKILAITAYLSETIVQAALQAGVSGLLEKSASLEEVRSALDNVIKGKMYLCARAAQIVAHGCVNKGRSPLEMLTQRELEALRCIAGGMRNKDIALHLCISVNTVEKHRANLMDKLNLRKVASLTAFAIEHGISTISAVPNGRATGVVEAATVNGYDRATPPPHRKKESRFRKSGKQIELQGK